MPSSDDEAGKVLEKLKPVVENIPDPVTFWGTVQNKWDELKSYMPSTSDVVIAAMSLGMAIGLEQFKQRFWEGQGPTNQVSLRGGFPSSLSRPAQRPIRIGRGSTHRQKGNAKIIGYGIPADPEVRYQQFGSYLIHTPSLRKNMINIKFPSLASHPKIPQTIASEELITLIQDLLREGKLNAKLYADLSEADKHYFTELAHTCKIGGKLGLSRKEENADMRRFAVLRGEILAGNDAPQIIKELKYLTLKLLSEGKIPKRSAHDLLFEIAVLT